MKRVAIFLLFAVCLSMAAVHASAQALPGPESPSMARIYFYRLVDSNQVVRWTSVWLNDAKVGDLGEATYFYRDIQPGTYRVGVSSDVPYDEQYRNVVVAAGGTYFVRVFNVPGYGIQVQGGGPFTPAAIYAPSVFGNRLIDPAVAQPEIARLQQAR